MEALPQIDYRRLLEGLCPICASDKFELVTLRFDQGRIVQCADCGHKYLNPTVPDDVLATIYAGYHASESDASLMAMIEGWFSDPHGPYKYVIEKLIFEDGLVGRRVLEVGCGPGRFIHECAKLGANVTGVDISPDAARLAKKYFDLELLEKSVEQAVKDGGLASGTFDVVCAFEIIEHVRSPRTFLDSLFQLLKPGGVIYLSTPNFYLFTLMGDAAEVVRQWPEHIHFFEPETLMRLLSEKGFEEVDVVSVSINTYGQRQKQRLAQHVGINFIWQHARKIRAVYKMKDVFFGAVDAYREDADRKCWNGRCIIGIGTKPVMAARS